MDRMHLSTALLTRLFGLYVILQGIRILFTPSRGENIGLFILGIIIPLTDLGVLLYGPAFIAAGLVVFFLIPPALPKLPRSVLRGALTALSCWLALKM